MGTICRRLHHRRCQCRHRCPQRSCSALPCQRVSAAAIERRLHNDAHCLRQWNDHGCVRIRGACSDGGHYGGDGRPRAIQQVSVPISGLYVRQLRRSRVSNASVKERYALLLPPRPKSQGFRSTPSPPFPSSHMTARLKIPVNEHMVFNSIVPPSPAPKSTTMHSPVSSQSSPLAVRSLLSVCPSLRSIFPALPPPHPLSVCLRARVHCSATSDSVAASAGPWLPPLISCLRW